MLWIINNFQDIIGSMMQITSTRHCGMHVTLSADWSLAVGRLHTHHDLTRGLAGRMVANWWLRHCSTKRQHVFVRKLIRVNHDHLMTPAHTVTLTSAYDHCSENNYF